MEMPIHSSVGTLQSVETSSFRRQVRLQHGNVAFFDTAATPLNKPNTPHTSPVPTKPKTLIRSCRVRISSDEMESLLGSSPPQEDDRLKESLASGPKPDSIDGLRSSKISSSKGSVGYSTRLLSSNKSSETHSTLDSSSFYNRSPSDEVFTSEEGQAKLSLSEAPSPSAILTPNTEVSDDSDDSYDRVLDLRDDLWDNSQFNYDLSSLNIDGLSQLSGKTAHTDDF